MHQILVGYIYLEDYIVHAYIHIILYPIVTNSVLKYNSYTENAQVGSLPSILTCLGSIFGVIVILSGVRFSSINREFPLNTSSTEATNSGGSRISVSLRLTRAKCGTRSTLCWKVGNISGSTELFAL